VPELPPSASGLSDSHICRQAVKFPFFLGWVLFQAGFFSPLAAVAVGVLPVVRPKRVATTSHKPGPNPPPPPPARLFLFFFFTFFFLLLQLARLPDRSRSATSSVLISISVSRLVRCPPAFPPSVSLFLTPVLGAGKIPHSPGAPPALSPLPLLSVFGSFAGHFLFSPPLCQGLGPP